MYVYILISFNAYISLILLKYQRQFFFYLNVIIGYFCSSITAQFSDSISTLSTLQIIVR